MLLIFTAKFSAEFNLIFSPNWWAKNTWLFRKLKSLCCGKLLKGTLIQIFIIYFWQFVIFLIVVSVLHLISLMHFVKWFWSSEMQPFWTLVHWNLFPFFLVLYWLEFNFYCILASLLLCFKFLSFSLFSLASLYVLFVLLIY